LLQRFLQGSLGDRPTDRPKDHAKTVKVEFLYSTNYAATSRALKLQEVAVDWQKPMVLEQSTRQIGSSSAISSYIQL